MKPIPLALMGAALLLSCNKKNDKKDEATPVFGLNAEVDCPEDMMPLTEFIDRELKTFKLGRYQTGGAYIYSRLSNAFMNDGSPFLDSGNYKNLIAFTESFYHKLDEEKTMGLAIPDEVYFDMAPDDALDLPRELTGRVFLNLVDSHLEDEGRGSNFFSKCIKRSIRHRIQSLHL